VKVGYGHFKAVPLDGELVRYQSEEEMTMNRGGSTVTQRVALISVESKTGELVRFESRANLGPVETVSRGEVTGDGKLAIETETAGKVIRDAIPWRADWAGFFAADQSLLRKPMKPGETRSLQALQPLVNQVGEIRLNARNYEETQLILGAQRLLHIDGRMTIAGVPIDMTIWADESGETWKTYLPNLQQTSYRATEDLARSKNSEVKYDLFDNITVRVDVPLDQGHNSQRVVYRARLVHGNPSEAFVSDAAQSVRPLDEQEAEVIVRAIRPDTNLGENAPSEPPTDDDLAPNSLIQSDDVRIKKMAAAVASDETNSWKIALALEQFVHQTISKKNFSQAFATAAEVAESREGDCTEHAVLLAALCRARKIPARAAMGLVYFPQQQSPGFAYHMWTEVWVNDRWIALDGTLGQGGIGAGHLKLAHSNLKGAGPYAAFLPVFRVLGQLELRIITQE
jgi:transglutaminase-like putative cysteine protease